MNNPFDNTFDKRDILGTTSYTAEQTHIHLMVERVPETDPGTVSADLITNQSNAKLTRALLANATRVWVVHIYR